jgi:hypothetical protein
MERIVARAAEAEGVEYVANRYRPERGEEAITVRRHEVRRGSALSAAALVLGEEEAARYAPRVVAGDARFEDFRYGDEGFVGLDALLRAAGR